MGVGGKCEVPGARGGWGDNTLRQVHLLKMAPLSVYSAHIAQMMTWIKNPAVNEPD